MSLYVSVFLCGLWMCCWPVSELSVVDNSGYANDDNRRAERGRRIASLGTPGGYQPNIWKKIGSP